MEDKSGSSQLTYHAVRMTINGVTRNVLVPLAKSTCHGRPVSTSGNTAIVTPNNATVTPATEQRPEMSTVGPTVVRPLRTQYPRTVAALARPCTIQTNRLSVIRPIQSINYVPPLLVKGPGGPGGRPVLSRKLMISTGSKTVTLETPAGESRVIRISPPATTASIVRVAAVRPRSTSPPRPIILRKNQRCSIVKPQMKPQQSVLPTYAINIQPATSSSSPLPASSLLTRVSCPRTLTKHEAIAAGWDNTGPGSDDDVAKQALKDDPAESGTTGDVVQLVPMETEIVSELMIPDIKPLGEVLNPATEGQLLTTSESLQVMSADSESAEMKVIEIVPNDDTGVDISDHDDDEDVKRRLPVIKSEADVAVGAMADDEAEYRSSSVSTVTAPSDGECPNTSSDDFVVLAEWSKDEMEFSMADSEASKRRDNAARRRANQRYNPYKRRIGRKHNWFTYKRSSPHSPARTGSVKAKARRTGGRPRTAAERHGIVDSYVSLPVMRLQRPAVLVRNCWRNFCCWHNQIQRCRCCSASSSTPRTSKSDVRPTTLVATTSGEVKVRELLGPTDDALVQPSMVVEQSSATLPVHVSGPTTDDGVTPLLVRQPDGKLSSVVAKRTNPDETSNDANKKKYLLIKARSGSYLVPVNAAATGQPAVQPLNPVPVKSTSPVSPPAACPEDVKRPASVSNTSAHRERIERLKQQLRQQEQQLDNIRSQMNKPGAIS